jgi:hypothetical protein
MNCATCKNWDTSKEHPLYPSLGKRCDALEESAKLWSESWDKAGIYTTPDFGCVLHEPRGDDAPAES